MTDEIKQPNRLIPVPPLNRTRDGAQRKGGRRPPEKSRKDRHDRPSQDDESHHIDEYA